MVNEKIYVVCPGGQVTGGPELLHQLVDELRKLGRAAYISYYPFDQNFKIPEAYAGYDVRQALPDGREGDLLILPESATKIAKRFGVMRIAIWWQSVDNYYILPPQQGWRKFVPARIAGRLARLPIGKLRIFDHYAQSEYARLHLLERGIEAKMLGDYLSGSHVPSSAKVRKNAIAYNPKKGKAVSELLVSKLSEIQFLPIENMDSKQVNALLSSVKIYMDFGNHPGKDRMPREAAIAGACVITGTSGAAGNAIDVDIPRRFKMEVDLELVGNFRARVEEIFNNFDQVSSEFDGYRDDIRSEREKFAMQCASIFGLTSSGD